MAAVYDYQTGNKLTEGLQGCNVCDEALQAAQRLADERGVDVELVDDDGRWLVHPAANGTREPADPLEDQSPQYTHVFRERGNGYPSIGDDVLCDGDVFRVTAISPIHTRQWAANYVYVAIEDSDTDLSELTEEEYDALPQLDSVAERE